MEYPQPPLELRDIVVRLMTYLVEYPEAKDTSEGVTRWWVGTSSSDFTSQAVQQALDWMTETAWVIKRKTATGEIIFGLNRSKENELKKFVRTLDQ